MHPSPHQPAAHGSNDMTTIGAAPYTADIGDGQETFGTLGEVQRAMRERVSGIRSSSEWYRQMRSRHGAIVRDVAGRWSRTCRTTRGCGGRAGEWRRWRSPSKGAERSSLQLARLSLESDRLPCCPRPRRRGRRRSEAARRGRPRFVQRSLPSSPSYRGQPSRAESAP